EDFTAAAIMRPLSEFLADHSTGRVNDADLAVALLNRIPAVADASGATLGGDVFTAVDLVVAELVRGDRRISPPSSGVTADPVDGLVAKWIGAYLDPHPQWPMPNRDRGLWAAWRAMARYDPQLSAKARRRLTDLPASADEGLADALSKLGLDQHGSDQVLKNEASRLPGWVGYIKWRSAHVGDIDLTSYLALCLTLRWALGLTVPTTATEAATDSTPAEPSAAARAAALVKILSPEPVTSEMLANVAKVLALHPPQDHLATWQSAYEEHYRQHLIASLPVTSVKVSDPKVQVVMCIDPRSEGMRRHLEVDADIETLGFAGFFGVPIRFASYQARGSIDALPALLSPHHAVTETATDMARATWRTNALRARDAFAAGVHASETAPPAPFALAEMVGWFSGAAALVRTLSPSAAGAIGSAQRRVTPTLTTEVTVASAFTLEERAAMAETGIRMMGLDRCAPLVILSGHGSTSANNLYQSALDCGACGGNPGAANARAAAAIFNDLEVRGILAQRGLPIPDATHFVAAEHNTVSDYIQILDPHLIPRNHAAAVQEFLSAQNTAADLLVAERAGQLPGATGQPLGRLRARANDWAEVYPELGLVRNAALIIGPRELTRGVDLERRVFMHSYRPECDPDGSALETIMTAPLVVAQWINHQYYFSTVDKDRWGSGTKTIHNAIGTIGVLAGQTGDLQVGLPLQSVAVGDRDLHEAMRLTVLIEAPLDRVGMIIARNQVLRHLFDNHWITLAARNNPTSQWQRYSTSGWIPDRRIIETEHIETEPAQAEHVRT
ncbi:MAG: DUF2309 domain-containing protein, partial [Salinibacterium sp.]|nr:DUF2309 domain-containing protein [Salinibacterium sp.]